MDRILFCKDKILKISHMLPCYMNYYFVKKKKESNLVLNLDIGLNFFETEGYLWVIYTEDTYTVTHSHPLTWVHSLTHAMYVRFWQLESLQFDGRLYRCLDRLVLINFLLEGRGLSNTLHPTYYISVQD